MCRSSPQETTGRSPFEPMFNRKMKDKLPALWKPIQSELDQEVRGQDYKAKEKGWSIADRKRRVRSSEIKTDNKVLLKNLPGNKLTTNFGPELYTVLSIVVGDCEIKSDASRVLRRQDVTALKKAPITQEPLRQNSNEFDRPPSPFLSSAIPQVNASSTTNERR